MYQALGASQSPYIGFFNCISLESVDGRPSIWQASRGNLIQRVRSLWWGLPCRKAVLMSEVKVVHDIRLDMERIMPRLILVKVGELVLKAPERASGSRKPCVMRRAFALGDPKCQDASHEVRTDLFSASHSRYVALKLKSAIPPYKGEQTADKASEINQWVFHAMCRLHFSQ